MMKKSEEYKNAKMSASLKRIPFRLCTVFKGHLLKDLNAKQNVICWLKRERGGSQIYPGKGPETNKPGFERPAHGRNVKRFDGEFVHRGEILVTQNGLKYYPGENVGIERTNRLFALCDGTVMITTDKINPYPDSPLYGPVQKGMEIKRKFFHIKPIPLHGKFRLVNEI